MQASLERELGIAFAHAKETWPRVRLDLAAFLQHVGERLPEPTEAGMAQLHLDDLYLACACLWGDPAATRAFSKLYLARVPEYVARVERSVHFAEEVAQNLAEKLLLGSGTERKLARYRGKGPLGAWMRVVAVREAQTLLRQRSKAQGGEALQVLADPSHDPEIAFLKRKHARDFEGALTEVLGTLSLDERTVLKLHYLDGLTLEQVARNYQISRATAARWIASAREAITTRVRAKLAVRLGADGPSPESVLAFVHSQLNMSLARHLF